MRKIIASFLITSLTTVYAQDIHWGYEGESGPDRWVNLSPEYFWCGLKNQSPVDISKTFEGINPRIEFLYENVRDYKIINNGHTVEIEPEEENRLVFDRERYRLVQFHFHSPSEHTVNHKNYPMEIHFVHKNEKNELLVLAVFVKEGKPNSTMKYIFDRSPNEKGEVSQTKAIEIGRLLPENRDYYFYSGSLTTPPCTEGVRWIILKKPITASKEEIDKFRYILKSSNNRPTQPLNGRFIIR